MPAAAPVRGPGLTPTAGPAAGRHRVPSSCQGHAGSSSPTRCLAEPCQRRLAPAATAGRSHRAPQRVAPPGSMGLGAPNQAVIIPPTAWEQLGEQEATVGVKCRGVLVPRGCRVGGSCHTQQWVRVHLRVCTHVCRVSGAAAGCARVRVCKKLPCSPRARLGRACASCTAGPRLWPALWVCAGAHGCAGRAVGAASRSPAVGVSWHTLHCGGWAGGGTRSNPPAPAGHGRVGGPGGSQPSPVATRNSGHRATAGLHCQRQIFAPGLWLKPHRRVCRAHQARGCTPGLTTGHWGAPAPWQELQRCTSKAGAPSPPRG